MPLSKDYDVAWKKHSFIGPSTTTRHRILTKLVRKYNLGGRIVDVGCGPGNLLLKLKNFSKNLNGIDISKAAIVKAKNKIPNGNFFSADITDYGSLPKVRFDLAICSEVIEHINEDYLALHNIQKILKPGGYLLLTVPHSKNKWTKHDEWAGHVRRYEKTELMVKLQKAGFKVLAIFVWGWPFYETYYRFLLSNIDPQKSQEWEWEKSTFKFIANKILYSIFKLDDFFSRAQKGRTIFAIAKKSN